MKNVILITLLALFINIGYGANNMTDQAIFAGGCFWCMQADFNKVPGVTKTVVGYIGGKKPNPTYQEVSAGGTGYYEAIEVTYNPKVINYQKLLTFFWHSVDPTDNAGQFCDKGQQYLSAIFYLNDQQKMAAVASKNKLIDSGKLNQVVTMIKPASTFYPAEAYHQNYYKKNPIRYKYYRFSCGRDKRLKQIWGDQAGKE